MMQNFDNVKLKDLKKIASKLALQIENNIAEGSILIFLVGDLGAGKSTFTRFILEKLGHKGPVPSPTYTLLESYAFSWGQLYHCDGYRLIGEKSTQSLIEEILEYRKSPGNCIIIEWPDFIQNILSPDIKLVISLETEKSRKITLIYSNSQIK